MFTDRKMFHFHYPGAMVKPGRWLKRGQKHEAPPVHHAQVVNPYAGSTQFGATEAHLVAGTSKLKSMYHKKQGQPSKNITQQEYVDVMSTLISEGRRRASLLGHCSKTITPATRMLSTSSSSKLQSMGLASSC